MFWDNPKEVFAQYGLSYMWESVETKAKNGIHILLKQIDEETLPLGQSKFGGRPDLPKEVEWFIFKEQPLPFIAQINLEEVQSVDTDNKLPKSGILYFFGNQDAWGFDPKDKGAYKVFFFKGDTNMLERKSIPSDLEEYSIYTSCKLTFSTKVEIRESTIQAVLTAEEQERYDSLKEEMNEEGCVNKLLGLPDAIQSEEMELECALVTNGLYCGDSTGYNDPRCKELEKNTDSWALLLQIDSDDETGMCWGDMGRVYFWIKKEDLKNEIFDNCWGILQCG